MLSNVRSLRIPGGGITAATISRLDAAGTITRLAQGPYQLADADVDANHTMIEAIGTRRQGIIA